MGGVSGLSGLSVLPFAPYMGDAYYVDATLGNDGNGGRAPEDAWQTIAQVNGTAFNPGDRVLFKRGETWVGTQLTIPSSGIPGAHIVFADYDVGARPLIDGNDLVNCIATNGEDYIFFLNLEVAQGISLGFNIATSANIMLTDCDGHDCGNEALSLDGCSNILVVRGEFYDGYQRVGGTTCAGIVMEDGAHDILIVGVTCRDGAANVNGLTIHNHPATVYPYNITVLNSTFSGNAQNGIYMFKADAVVDTDRNILFQNCVSQDNGNYGLNLTRTGVSYIDGVTFDVSSFVSNTGTREIYCRGDNVTFQRCIINIDSARGIYASACQNLSLLQCTFYSSAAGDFLVVVEDARTLNFVMQNCIARGNLAGVNMISIVAGTGIVGMTIDYNLWGYTGGANRWFWLGAGSNWVNWLINSGQDVNSPVPADPLFVVPGTDFHLQVGSPARGVGTDLGYGTDIGRYQYAA